MYVLKDLQTGGNIMFRDCEIMLNISPIILFLDSQNLSLLFFRNEPIILRLFSEKWTH